MPADNKDLLLLIRRRESVKRRLGKLLEGFESLRDSERTLVRVNIYIQDLTDLRADANEYQNSILEECDDANVSVQEEAFEAIQVIFRKVKTILLSAQDILKRAQQQMEMPHRSEESQNNRLENNVRLPRIDLPVFDGRIDQWTSFYDLFIATIHNNATLTPAQKLQYLKAAVKGDAANLIISFQITDANYQEALDILKERYDNKRDIIFSHAKRLLTQPAMTRESACGLQKLLDTTNECLRALRTHGQPVDQWDTLLILTVAERMDSETKKQWALQLKGTDLPTYKQLAEFIQQHVRGLQAGTESKSTQLSNKQHGTAIMGSHAKRQAATHHASSQSACGICKGDHGTYKCSQFLSATMQDRQKLVKQHNLCFNCLKSDHRLTDCKSSSRCRKCNKQHNTLLHQEVPKTQQSSTNSAAVSSHLASRSQAKQVLLLTALVNVKDSSDDVQTFRMLIDPGSQASFITERCVRRLGLKRSKCDVQITGISASPVGSARGLVELEVSSRLQDFRMPIKALILKKVTGVLPRYPCSQEILHQLNKTELADPSFHEPGSIDILLGAEHSSSIMRDGLITGSESTPYAHNSVFGWLVSGNAPANYPTSVRVHHTDIDFILRRFWELEELPPKKHLTPEELACQNHFAQHHVRDNSGRYTVKLPLTDKINRMGNSADGAIHRFKQLERRLARDPARKSQYSEFIHEYLALHHMEPVPEHEVNQPCTDVFYLPHHCIIRDQSSTTKLRVVFDGSAKSTSGVSINDCMMVGPTIQDDVLTILLRFRTHIIALKADITKMYRQFRMHDSHAELQRIIWRDNPTDELQHFRLLTITYGTAAAPYLATRCLQQLANDEKETYPEAAKVLREDFYVDDVLSGASSVQEAIYLQQQLSQLVASGGMELRKWASSNCDVMAQIAPDMREKQELFNFDDSNTLKALGIQWSPAEDSLLFSINPTATTGVITKRNILSEIGKIFDPLGLLAPTTIQLKLIMQELWRRHIDWDKELPTDILASWQKHCGELSAISKFRMPRCITSSSFTRQEIHGFCDASMKAYAAAVYLRTVMNDGSVMVRLICAKAKVSPIKSKSIPRLELCGALLLSQLLTTVKKATGIECNIFAWTDSTTVLNWLSAFPGKWKTFVANRVAEIQESIPRQQWFHVPTADNPADCGSRGLGAAELENFDLWWNGPQWLHEYEIPHYLREVRSSTNLACECSASECTCEDVRQEEQPTRTIVHVCIENSLLTRSSNYNRLLRTTAYCFRFLHNSRNPTAKIVTTALTADEISHAEFRWIKTTQQDTFGLEISSIKKTKDNTVPSNSKLSSLTPYIDGEGLLRVGGRLQRLDSTEERRHPIILPHNHTFTILLIQHMHRANLHCGFQLLWGTMQQKYWILRARDTIRHIIRKCVICRRQRAVTAQQLMGSIPSCRLNPGRPFLHCGVDYAGPFGMRIMKGRNLKIFKSYFAIFVCMTTKAVHLEAVSDLSTEAFIAAFRRFASRRGHSTDMYSDCGTNFVGADAELKSLLQSSSHNNSIQDHLSSQGVNWHFNPPSAPHQGGLWEAGVKSVKHHLRRVIGNTTLTFEEFQTVLCQIEACLNSRPLTSMSNDPSDFNVLTPGHFLIGMPINAIPGPDLTATKMNRLSRWQLMQQLVQHFWRRWHAEYVSSLQQRFKWKTKRENLQINDLVLIKDETLPPTKWKLGRILSVFPGLDNNVRVAKVKTANAEFERPIVKLCPILTASD